MNNRLSEAFAGIDMAFAKKKRLAICVCINDNGQFMPLELRGLKGLLPPPPGQRNKAALMIASLLKFWPKKQKLRKSGAKKQLIFGRLKTDLTGFKNLSGLTI